jgi:S-adenosylmethionine hydrolase
MSSRLITLTTDFGTSDHFAGVMKGVILGIAPRVQVVDITHEISPFDIAEAGFVVAQAYPHFPRKTIHVVVVDPGVGSDRRPILVDAGGHYFIGPDNGVFTEIYAAEPRHKVRHMTNHKFFLPEISRTFHGRDVFAPAAAHLANGESPARFGKLITDFQRAHLLTPQRIARRVWTGNVVKVDRFGNLITNFHVREFADVTKNPFEMRAGLEPIHLLAHSYADTSVGDIFLIVGSSGHFEIAVNQGSAAKRLGCAAGSPLELEIIYG